MDAQRPTAVARTIWLLIGVVLIDGLIALLTLVFRSQLVDSWAAGRTDVGTVEPPAFAPVVITMFVVVALLILVLLSFFAKGHDWARILLSALLVLMGIATLAALRADLPVLFRVAAAVSLLLDLAAVVLLWHRDTRAFTRRDWAGSRPTG